MCSSIFTSDSENSGDLRGSSGAKGRGILRCVARYTDIHSDLLRRDQMVRALRGAVFFSPARAARAGSDILWGLRAPESPAAVRFAPAGLPRGGAPERPLIHHGVTVYDPLRLE